MRASPRLINKIILCSSIHLKVCCVSVKKIFHVQKYLYQMTVLYSPWTVLRIIKIKEFPNLNLDWITFKKIFSLYTLYNAYIKLIKRNCFLWLQTVKFYFDIALIMNILSTCSYNKSHYCKCGILNTSVSSFIRNIYLKKSSFWFAILYICTLYIDISKKILHKCKKKKWQKTHASFF